MKAGNSSSEGNRMLLEEGMCPPGPRIAPPEYRSRAETELRKPLCIANRPSRVVIPLSTVDNKPSL